MTTEQIITLVVAIIGALTGVAGLGLSIFTLKRQLDDDKVKLDVVASWAMAAGPGAGRESFFAIRVTNLSKFAVVVDEAGVFVQDNRKVILPGGRVNPGDTLPVTLQPRTGVSVLFPAEFLRDPATRNARCAFAGTACGTKVESAAGVLPQMVETAQG